MTYTKSKNKDYHFQNIEMIPLLLRTVSGTLVASKDQRDNMRMAKKPFVLDDEIIKRSEKVYRAQIAETEFFLAQCKYWKQSELTEAQLQQIYEIETSTNKLREINAELLSILEYSKSYTIDKILKKDNMELALEVLTGKKS